ncbi:LCCL domain-containing protein [Siccirubricoccus sp. G192]|uniref:LCCL domain-containing protein n=1 Tax=Siccirubricoccus sp. G192 TaxID=2849651 RepID=UPI001C2C42D0|nr:LCCL domain-containing protein [Siccirubricoccus sp. G192]MBV1799372.1 OmpA family protein [Siccirubricoccus sp. G192]
MRLPPLSPALAGLLMLILGVVAAPPARAQDACPENFEALAGSSKPLTCACTAAATAGGAVWGSGTYTADSAVCRAALHAGIVTPGGGTVTLRPEPGRPSYPGSSRNGVESQDYGAWGASFRFEGPVLAAPAEPAGAKPPPAAPEPAPGKPPAADAAAAPADPGPPGQCPDNFEAFRGTTEPLACTCPPEATERGSVWGMDVYTDDSSICRAAIHAGLLGRRGGTVTLLPEPGRRAYPGSTRNGVQSQNYGPWQGSFRFRPDPARQQAQAQPQTPPPPAAPSQCPDNFEAYKHETDPLVCTCTELAAAQGAVWGTDLYTSDSAICRAALHAGRITRRGGLVTALPEPGRRAYPGTTRNGVQSQNYGPWDGSFRFGGEAPQQQAATGPATPSQCPDNFEAYKHETEPLTCLCPAEAGFSGAVWGSEVYTSDSRVCRAALHAGAIGRMGGTVTLLPEPGRRAYAGSTRNGVQSSNYGPWDGSFRFQPGKPQQAAAAPVQAPVGETLRATGQVQLYITFRTGSADLDLAAAPVLMQLRDALMADPALRLRLIGHTDNTGTPAGNRQLSLRRADSVRAWLASQGVDPARLVTDGRGQDEPIAENTSEAGRALNRRVQAARLP